MGLSEQYAKGSTVTGRVKAVDDFGFLVVLDAGGQGHIHWSDLSWERPQEGAEQPFKEGDSITAQVLDFNSETQQFTLGVKQLTSDPWASIEQSFPVGSVVNGEVVKVFEFGVFVELVPGVEGLIHVTDLSWSKRTKDGSEAYKIGDPLTVQVDKIDTDNKRLSLTIKDMTEDPWLSAEDRYGPGQTAHGKVVSHTTFGLFVELEPGIEGLVHKSDLVTSSAPMEAAYPEGRELQVQIQSIDSELQKMSLAEVAPKAKDKQEVEQETTESPDVPGRDHDADLVSPSNWQTPTSLIVSIIVLGALAWLSRMIQ